MLYADAAHRRAACELFIWLAIPMINRIKIPEARIGVLIGEGGEIKKRLQKNLSVSISINSATGEVEVNGDDAMQVLTAENVIKAVGRGFDPRTAFKLLDESYALEIISLPKNEKQLRRIKSRLIGEKGRAKENIEQLSECDIEIYGRTVAIIGEWENVERARDAILRLMKGFPHASVYALLEKARKQY
jgi:ribosomal RNA assembly protein